jgi:hypothetical protein
MHSIGSGERSLDALAFSAPVHCLTACAIGEVLGMIIGCSSLARWRRS